MASGEGRFEKLFHPRKINHRPEENLTFIRCSGVRNLTSNVNFSLVKTNGTTTKYFPKSGHFAGFDLQTKKFENHTVSQNKRHHIKVLFSSFAKNGHTAWFDPQTKKIEPHCITKQTAPHERTVQ